MYKVSQEGDDTVIRLKRDLMNQGAVARLLDLVQLSAVLEQSRFAEAMITAPVTEATSRK